MRRFSFRRLADWEIRHRRRVVLGLATLTLLALVQLPRLRFDFRPEALLEFSPEEQAFADDFHRRFGIRDNLLLVAVEGPEPGAMLDARGLALLHRLTGAAGVSEIADQAVSLTTVPRRDAAAGLAAFALGRLPPLIAAEPVTDGDASRVRSQLEVSRMLPRQLVSEDGSTAAVVVAIKDEYRDPARLDRPLAELQAALGDLVAAAGAADAEARGRRYELHFGGLPFVRLETVRNLKSEQRRFWPVTAALYLALLWLLYRDVGLAVTPLLAVGLASLWGVALLPLAGSEVNVVNNIVPSLILVIGVCNAIHMLHAYASARRRGAGGEDASRSMMAELGLPVFLTSLTTAIGFASLLVARNGTLRDLGWQAGAGIMASYLALVTLLPIAVCRFGGRTSGAGLWRPRAAGRRALEALVGFLAKHPRRTLAVSAGVLVAALASGLRVPVDSLVLDTFPPGSPIWESNRVVEEKLGGILPLEIQLKNSDREYFTRADTLRQVFSVQRELERRPGVLDVKSVVDLIAEVHGARSDERVEEVLTPDKVAFALATLRTYQPQALAMFLSEDRSETRLAARLGDHGIRASLGLLDWIEGSSGRWLEPFDSPVSLRLTGEAYIASRGLDYFIRDLIASLLTAGGVIFGVLVAVFRSTRMGLLSFLPTVLPLALTLGLMPLYGYELNTSTVVVFTISIGMAVDNTIHLLTAFRRARRKGVDLEPAIIGTFRHTGAAVVASNLLLIGGFAILFSSDFEPVFRVAALTTTTIGAAMVASILVLPPLLSLWGGPIGRDEP